MRNLVFLAFLLLALGACRLTLEPPPGTGYQDRWNDHDRGR